MASVSPCHQVMQTLFEAEQVCAEMQNSVSGLDTRLAELLLWEMEARELYELLRAADPRPKQQGQDPRARVRANKCATALFHFMWETKCIFSAGDSLLIHMYRLSKCIIVFGKQMQQAAYVNTQNVDFILN